MRKVHPKYENPIDNVLIDLADILCPLFKRFSMTPNGITTLSLIFGIIAILCLIKGKYICFGISFFVSYFFDIMDGHYARKYKMTSKFGDMYDHAKDVIVFTGIFAVFLYRNRMSAKKQLVFLTVFTILLALAMCMHLGCQEKIYPKEESDTLHFSKQLCMGNPYEHIRWTKYFGCGTFIVITILLIIYVERNRKNSENEL